MKIFFVINKTKNLFHKNSRTSSFKNVPYPFIKKYKKKSIIKKLKIPYNIVMNKENKAKNTLI